MKIFPRRREFLIALTILIIISGFFVGENNIAAKTPSVIINEIMWMGSSVSSSDEWIELRNMTDKPVDLSGWQLTKYSKVKGAYRENLMTTISGGKSIPANSYFLIANYNWDSIKSILNIEPDLVNTAVSLANSKLQIKLYDGDWQNKTSLIDTADDSVGKPLAGKYKKSEAVYYSMERNNIYGNGTEVESWHICLRATNLDEGSIELATPGAENSRKPPPITYSSKIRINELFPDPKEKPEKNYEYIELYNYGDEEIDLENWEIKDANILKKENGKGKKLSGIIRPKKYLAFYKTVSLNNGGDKIKLFNPNGDEVDSVGYNKAKENYSYCFNGGKWEWTPFLTPGKANQFKVKKNYSHSVHINEILPNPSGDEKLNEYIELYNPSDKNINLSEWILKDSSKRGKFVFPGNSLIKPRNFLVIYRSDFKFAMNNSGSETVYLLDPNENSVSSISYSGAKEDVSYNFNGLSWRWSKFLTPGAKNKFNNLPKVETKIDKKIYKNVYADFKVKINDPDKDKIKVVWDFGDGRKSYKKKTRHKYKETGKYSASLKVFDGSEEIIKKFKIEVKKFPRPKVRITRLMPNPKGKDSQLEWIEIKNKSKKEINLKNWSIATGSSGKKITNHPIYEDFFIRPGKVKKIMRDLSRFSLNNKKCRIELRYPDGRVAYKVKYKKEDGVKDDEVYGKEKGGKWKWTKIVLDVQDVQVVEIVEDEEDVEIVQDVEDEEEIKKFINGQSVKLADDKRLKLLIGELDIEALEKIIVNLDNLNIKEVNNIYIFNSLSGGDKHYASKFLEKLLQEINQTFNNQLNLLN